MERIFRHGIKEMLDIKIFQRLIVLGISHPIENPMATDRGPWGYHSCTDSGAEPTTGSDMCM